MIASVRLPWRLFIVILLAVVGGAGAGIGLSVAEGAQPDDDQLRTPGVVIDPIMNDPGISAGIEGYRIHLETGASVQAKFHLSHSSLERVYYLIHVEWGTLEVSVLDPFFVAATCTGLPEEVCDELGGLALPSASTAAATPAGASVTNGEPIIVSIGERGTLTFMLDGSAPAPVFKGIDNGATVFVQTFTYVDPGGCAGRC